MFVLLLKILDDQKNDITPRLITDYAQTNIKTCCEDRKIATGLVNDDIVEKQESSNSNQTMVATKNLTTSNSHMIHTGTLFSAG